MMLIYLALLCLMLAGAGYMARLQEEIISLEAERVPVIWER